MALKVVDARRLVEYVCERTHSFFETELAIPNSHIQFHFSDVQRLTLDYLTSILAVEGPVRVMFAMSFDRNLAEYSTQKYTEELDIPEDELELYLEETVADIINIILGNSLSRFQLEGETITLSPPVVITEAKNIYRHKDAQFFTADVQTKMGRLQIFCIGPRELFDCKLDYLQEEL